MLLPAPLGPIRPTISPGRISNERSLTATRPPNCLARRPDARAAHRRRVRALARAAAAARSGTGGGARCGQQAREPRPDARRARGAAAATIRMPNTTISKLPLRPEQSRQHVLQHLLRQRDQRRADHRAPHAARAADDRHEQVLDALVDAERRRIDEPLQVRVEPARDAGEQRRVDEDDDLEPRGVDAERLGHRRAAPSARGSRGRAANRAGCRVAHSAASAIAPDQRSRYRRSSCSSRPNNSRSRECR